MRADRLLSIMLLLQTRGKLTMVKLADELEVSRRTVVRDIEALSIAGVPVYTEGGHGGGVWLDDKYRVSLTGLKDDELRSLLVNTLPGPLSEIGLERAKKDSWLKLVASLSTAHQAEVERNNQRLVLDPMGWWPNINPTRFLTPLQTAVYQDQMIEVRYERANGTLLERTLEPYSLATKANVWYLVARQDQEFRTYRISRFHEVILLPVHFTRSKDFDLIAYWQDQSRTFIAGIPQYVFTLRLTYEGLQLLRRYNKDVYPYKVIEQPAPPVPPNEGDDGWLSVRIELGSINEARMLVLGMGPTRARVVEPAELHTAVLQAAAEFLHDENWQTVSQSSS